MQDVQTIDIDHMFEKLDFTYNKVRYAGLPDLVETKLHNQGKRLVLIVVRTLFSRLDFGYYLYIVAIYPVALWVGVFSSV